jgi:hypothetical protein
VNELDSTGDQLEFRQGIPTRAPYLKRLVTGGVMVTAVIVDFHRTQEGRRTPHNCLSVELKAQNPKNYVAFDSPETQTPFQPLGLKESNQHEASPHSK